MKANELRIGNWITAPMFEQPFQVDLMAISQAKHCRPILLTEQWIKDFGFVRISEFNDDLGIYKLSLNSSSKLEDLYSSSDFNIGISIDDFVYCWNFEKRNKYVHLLQNLYFALTGKELTKHQ